MPRNSPTGVYRLSKSRFTSGLQCHKKLWWEVHEPDALELQPDTVLQDLFDQGRQVGELARTRYPGGVLIDLPHHARAERVAATRKALDAGAPAVFEATFIADNTYVAIDVLEKQGDGYRLTEVKSSTSQKDEHIPDVAVQARVAAACGVQITAADVLHLNKEFRHPDSNDLFARTDVTGPVAAFLPQVADEIARQREMLAGPLRLSRLRDDHPRDPRLAGHGPVATGRRAVQLPRAAAGRQLHARGVSCGRTGRRAPSAGRRDDPRHCPRRSRGDVHVVREDPHPRAATGGARPRRRARGARGQAHRSAPGGEELRVPP